jgi:hypothetical protein
MKAYIEERSQHSKGSWPRSGPDRYVAVQIVPDNVEPLICLNRTVAAKRGIKIIYCGEGYSDRDKTDRSMLNQARQKALKIKERYCVPCVPQTEDN